MIYFQESKTKKKSNKKVFLGGTVDGDYRPELKEKIKIDYFDPIVPKEEWNEKCQEEERKQRKECDYCLYIITPHMTGVLAIAEVTDDSNKRPKRTVFCYLKEYKGKKFSESQCNSLDQVAKMVKENGATVCKDLDDVARYLNM